MVPAAVYQLDHLITLAVNTPEGLSLEDGLRQLCDIEAKGGGIWALRVEMQIDEQNQQLVIVDKAAAVEIDKMLLSSINNINSSGADKRAAYSNVLALNVLTDDGANRLHLFMCCNDQASDVVANIRLAKQGQSVRPSSYSKPIGSQKKSNDSDNDKFILVSNNFKQDEITQHNVTMFNHCLDDIEKFVALLQEAARKYSYSQSYSQSSSFGYPIIPATTNKEPSLPSGRDLVDILKKFKMAFNLLYKLQGVLRDPNAAELVHFLFSTLTLVVETSRDGANGQLTLASNVVSPLFYRATLDFLTNTVTAKERDLLRSLGDAWNISRESWQGYVPPFFPSFRSGFQPPPSWLDDKPSTGTAVPLRSSQQPVKSTNSRASNGYERQDSGFKDETDNEIASGPRNGSVPFEQSLRQKGADMAEVTSTRMASNDKELTVREGEILEILDSSRNWWHARNSVGLTGYVPYTALKRIP